MQSVVGSVLGTLTFRYPIPCSRFAPYAFVGGGGIFGGGSRSILLFDSEGDLIAEQHNNTTTKPVGQFGGGCEVRFTPTIGWINDFSWKCRRTGRRTTSGWSAAAFRSRFNRAVLEFTEWLHLNRVRRFALAPCRLLTRLVLDSIDLTGSLGSKASGCGREEGAKFERVLRCDPR